MSPLLFLVPKQFYPSCFFVFFICGFYKKQHVLNQHILFTYHSVALPRELNNGRYISILWFTTALLLKSKTTTEFLPQIGAEKALQPCPSQHISCLVDMLSLCHLCSCLWLRNVLVYRIRSMPYSSPGVKWVEIKRLHLSLISKMTEDRRSKQLYLRPL